MLLLSCEYSHSYMIIYKQQKFERYQGKTNQRRVDRLLTEGADEAQGLIALDHIYKLSTCIILYEE